MLDIVSVFQSAALTRQLQALLPPDLLDQFLVYQTAPVNSKKEREAKSVLAKAKNETKELFGHAFAALDRAAAMVAAGGDVHVRRAMVALPLVLLPFCRCCFSKASVPCRATSLPPVCVRLTCPMRKCMAGTSPPCHLRAKA